ncbi:unnamed protein product [Rotaria sp. Silwood2]|nr:unnamed protein product [Rotaria sp. Silwood2]CAF3975208.1 unnamed protein product [Rotaria sp. Silwood2]CAF3976433.1 unnamed protein product [Rotaria sp. Silwood2]
MATKLVPSSNIGHPIASIDEPISNGAKSILSELRRLATFRTWKGDNRSVFSKGLLAKTGLYYIETSDKMKCEGCDFEYELSSSNMNPIDEHRKRSPKCLFVLDQNKFLSKNDRQTTCLISNSLQTNVSDYNRQQQTNRNENDEEDSSNTQTLFLNSITHETVDQIRTNTFSNWPLITPTAPDMIIAGWAYTNIADRVICIYCKALFHKWEKTDRPYEIHRLKSPKCPFVLLMEKKSPSSSTTKITITTEPNTQAAAEAVNNTYSLAYRRYETFQNWPHTKENPLPSVDSFVDAGFFYTGEKAIVKCFYCNGALRNWQSSDDPKVEHCRWYPQCAYIRQYIGEDLYQAIQRKNHELKSQQNYNSDPNDQRSKAAPWTDNEIDRMVKARLDLPVVETLRKMGFTMAVIRKAFEIQLKYKHDDFKSDNDLRVACLMLHQQVISINGNESNLLVPQDWMKKYLEDQEQNMEQSELQQPQTSGQQIENIETPKVLAPVVTRPKITQQTDEQAMLCILCLTTERQVACLPCGHLASCVACGYSLKVCPICRAAVKAFVRIYV